MKRRLLQLTLGLAISAGVILVLLQKTDVAAVSQAIGAADARLIGVAVAVYLFAMCIRTVVWGRLLSARVPRTTLFQIVIVGFAINFVMPLRVGEIARAYLLKHWSGVDYGTSAASIISERVLDGVAVGSIILITLMFVPAPAYIFVLGVSVAGGFAVLMACLVVASTRGASLLAVTSALAARVPRRFAAGVDRLGRGFAAGLQPLRNWRALPGLLALSMAGWICQFLVFYLVMLALSMPASLPVALIGGGIAQFATLLPSAPGFVGTFDAVVMNVVMDFLDVSLDTAAAYAVVVHTIVVVPMVVLGALVLWRANLSVGHVISNSVRTRRSAAQAATIASTVNTTSLPL
jgi:uncharacterized protein (TIRG00374 family)